MTPTVVVLGSSFGGLTAAFALKRELGPDVHVRVISPSDRFVFNPSLIWLPFGRRTAADVTFTVEAPLAEHGIEFVHAAATAIDPSGHRVRTGGGTGAGGDTGTWHPYDYLVVATGYQNNRHAVPGLAEHAHTITTLDDAGRTGQAWNRFLENPGPVVVGATAGASCFGAAYEFLFNLTYQLRKHGLKRQVPVTYVTPEPFLGHFGIDGLPHGESLIGLFFGKELISPRVNAEITRVDPDAVALADGSVLPSALTMLIPPFLGQDVVRSTPELSDEKGYVPVRATYQSEKFDDVYAVGIAAAVAVPWQSAIPVGVPKTGYPTEVQAHVAAANIATQISGRPPTAEKPFGRIPAVCVLDAGNNGVVLLADAMLPPRKHAVMIPGPQAHAMKLAFEKYFLWKMRRGLVQLP